MYQADIFTSKQGFLRRPCPDTRMPLDDFATRTTDQPAIGIDGAVDQVSTEPGHRFDELSVLGKVPWISPETDTRAVHCNEPLNDHRHRAPRDIEAELLAVEQRCVGP